MTIEEGVPDSVTEELVRKIWREYIKDAELQVKNCRISLVGGKGDNYSSIMCRAVCKVVSKDGEEIRKMVIKTFPTGEAIQEYVKESRSFEKEIKMLQEVLPEIENILENAGIEAQLGAKIYFTQSEPYFIMAMEDLSELNFDIASRFVGLCLEECLILAKSLAKLHAGSIVYLKNHPEAHDGFFDKWIWGSDKKPKLDIGIRSSLTTIIENVDSWSSVKWSDKLQKLLDTRYPDAMYEVVDRKNTKRPMVLNHGDLWLNNIMFSHLSAKSPELRFVDLQLSWINSPVFDLIYFLFTSPRAYVRFNQMDRILGAYHQEFTEVTAKLGIPQNYSYEDLKEDFHDNLMLGFGMAHFLMPITTAPRQQALGGDHKVEDDIMKDNPIFSNEFFKQSFLSTLPFFEEHGIL